MEEYQRIKKKAEASTPRENAVELAREVDRRVTDFYNDTIEEEVGPSPEKMIADLEEGAKGAKKSWADLNDLRSGRKSTKELIHEMVEERRAKEHEAQSRPGMYENMITGIRDSWKDFVRYFSGQNLSR